MTTTQSQQAPQHERSRASLASWLLAIALVLVIGAGVLTFLFIRTVSQPDPVFSSLVQNPDVSITGTVAYYDDSSRCIRITAASGARSKDIYCLEDQKTSDAEKSGKWVGAHLFWRPDNTLEVTEFRMVQGGPDPIFEPAWQKVFNVADGTSTDTPLAKVAKTPTPDSRPTLSPSGEQLATESSDGKVKVTLTDKSGNSKTLLNAKGNFETYSLKEDAFWSPDFTWVIANDNHVLVITPNDQPTTRQLTPALTSDYGYDALHWFDVTSKNLF